jgi:hypothetical protein
MAPPKENDSQDLIILALLDDLGQWGFECFVFSDPIWNSHPTGFLAQMFGWESNRCYPGLAFREGPLSESWNPLISVEPDKSYDVQKSEKIVEKICQ